MLYTIQFSELKDTIPHVSDAKMYLVCADNQKLKGLLCSTCLKLYRKKFKISCLKLKYIDAYLFICVPLNIYKNNYASTDSLLK